MAKSIDVQLRGHSFQLLAERGMYWPAQSILFIADTHFGKEASFRRGGIPVPIGLTEATLDNITLMLRRTQSKKLCILGDMFHDRSSLADDVCQSLRNFFAKNSDIAVSLVIGNHDLRVGELPEDWRVSAIQPGATIDGVKLGHQPIAMAAAGEVYLCGHIHPAIRFPSRKMGISKLPCFWYSRGQLVLPALGEFTGTHVVESDSDDQVWVMEGNEIFAYATC